MVCQQGGELIVLTRVLWEGASGELEYSVKGCHLGTYTAVSTFAGLAGAKLIMFVSPWIHCWGQRRHGPPPGPSGEGQSDLRDLFSLKCL